MTTSVGTCSLCGGRVSVPTVYHSIIPPVPQCESCGAVAASHGPVVPMKPGPTIRTTTTLTLKCDGSGSEGSTR